MPDSGLDAAIGYSRQSGIPYALGFIKNKYIGRTFIAPGQKSREDKVRIKLNPISDVVRGKRVVLIDDSIVRGTTSARIVKLLRSAGATEIHMRISAPPFLNPCYYGTDIDSREHLIACHHTVEEIEEKFRMARSLGFDNINMDLIVGLPGEDKEKVAHTLEKVEALNPDSLTVHSLALKRATRLNLFKDKYQEISFENSAEIMKMTMDSAHRMEMGPYYMYRQKNMAGNFENVGYSREGKAGIYNILIMEEKQSILAAGAGASTKFVFEHGERIERVENVKDLKNYVERIDEMIERKRIGMEKYLPK